MPDYRLTWEIDIEDADDPVDAARKALEIYRRPDSEATVFEVRPVEPVHGHPIETEMVVVDLTERTIDGEPFDE